MSGPRFDYVAEMSQLEAAVRVFHLMTESLDLAQVQQTLQRVDTLGPILDPTAYNKALHEGRIERQVALVRAAAHLMNYTRARAALEGASAEPVGA